MHLARASSVFVLTAPLLACAASAESSAAPLLVFGLAPDGWSWLGMAIIGVCGAASAWLNVRAAAERHRPVSAVQADTVAE